MNDKTRQMAELHKSGWTLAAIGEKFGMTHQAVLWRLNGAGINCSRSVYKQIDRNRLASLYSDDRRKITDIADILEVSEWIIRAALQYYEIPKRRRLIEGGYAVDFLKGLQLHEAAAIKLRGTFTNHLYFTAKTDRDQNICQSTW